VSAGHSPAMAAADVICNKATHFQKNYKNSLQTAKIVYTFT